MQAFKAYWKVFFKGSFLTCVIFSAVFIGISILISQSGSNNTVSFEAYSCETAIINNDNSPLAEHLSDYLKSKTTETEIGTDEDSIRDAMFARAVRLVVKIPEGFGKSFSGENPLTVETLNYPDVAAAEIVKQYIENYLTTAKLYLDGTGTIDFANVEEDLEKSAVATLSEKEVVSGDSPVVLFINWFVYTFVALFCFCIAFTMVPFRKQMMKRRNECSPVKSFSFSLQLFLANFLFGLAIYVINIGIAFILFTDAMLSAQGAMLIINSFILLIVGLSLAFLVSYLATPKTIYAIANLLSLFLCFFGGVFVPQELLSDGIKNLSVFTPSYWFILTNKEIQRTSSFMGSDKLFEYFGIELLFAVVFLAATLVVVKLKRKS